MSIISTRGGEAFGTKSGAMFVSSLNGSEDHSPANFTNPLGNNDEISGEVAMWGSNNKLPDEMRRDIEATGVLSQAVDIKARIAIGKGPLPARIVGYNKDGYEELEFVSDAEIHDWLEMNSAFENGFATVKDLNGWGNAWTNILLSADRKRLVSFKRVDATLCRFSKRDERTRRSEYTFVSGDWDRYTSWNKSDKVAGKHFDAIPLLDRNYPVQDLLSRKSGHSFMISIQYPLFGRQYYSPAPWYVAKKWVKIAQSIPEMKSKMFDNQMTIKYVVDIHPEFWVSLDPQYTGKSIEDQKAVREAWFEQVDEYLTGNSNAYKSIFSRQVYDKAKEMFVPGFTITTIDDKIKEGKLLPDSAAANSEILFAMAMNPALMGADMPGGPYSGGSGSGSNIREAYLVQVMLLEMERRLNSKIFDIAKKMNGWQDRLGKGKPLVLRYPNQILTTLNTGKNTQAIP